MMLKFIYTKSDTSRLRSMQKDIDKWAEGLFVANNPPQTTKSKER